MIKGLRAITPVMETTMTNDLTTIDYKSAEVLQTLKSTVAQGATDTEFKLFVQYCQSTGLNPFKREVWFIKTKGYQKKDGSVVEGKVQIMTGINGFLAIANRHPQYDGLECDVAVDESGKVLMATAKVWRKDRRFPSVATALMSEYYKPNPYGKAGIWEQMPSIMIAKCAKALALREAFPQELNGLYTQEEMPNDYAMPAVAPVVPAPVVAEMVSNSTVDSETGEVKDASDTDHLPWEKPDTLTKSKAVATRYDVSGLSGSQLTKAESYLKDNLCKQVGDGLWECPIRLEKLTSCVCD